jgi:hypothetical protein
MLSGIYPSIPVDKNGDVQLYDGSDAAPISLPNLGEKLYSSWPMMLVKEESGRISAIRPPNDGDKYVIVTKNGTYYYEKSGDISIGEYDYVIPIPDLVSEVSFLAEWNALQAANPTYTVKVVKYFIDSDSTSDSALGDAGLDLTAKKARFLGNKPSGESHTLNITLGVY